MSGHSLVSPSALARRLACPGSLEQEKGLPDTESVYSREGTRAHALLEEILNIDAVDVGEQDPDMYRYCMEAAQFVWDLMAEDPELELFVEQPVDPSRLFGRGETSGTADIILTSPTHLYVYDFKYGAGVDVPALHNKQCLAYGAGAVCSLYTDGVKVPEFYHFGIIQPRTPGPMVKQWDMGMMEFREECSWIKTQLSMIVPGAPRSTGDHCTFCKAKRTCYQRQGEASAAITEAFNAVTLGNAATVSDIPMKPPEVDLTNLSNEQLAQFVDRSALIKAVLDDCRAELRDRIMAGGEGCGYKVVRGTANRKWTLSDAELAKKFKNMKLKEEDYYDKKVASPATVEKCSKLTERQLENLKKLWTKPEGKLTLKSTSAPGTPVVNLDTAAAFSAAVEAEAATKPETLYSFI